MDEQVVHAAIVATRGLGKFLVGGSVARVMKQIVKNNVIAETRPERIRLAVATYAISGLVADQTTRWFGDRFDATIEQARQMHRKTQDMSVTFEMSAPEQPTETSE